MHHKVLVLALIALAFACAAPAFAQTTQGSLYFEELTWPEIGDAIKAGKTTIIIPTGGIEDKGPHMAVSAHSVTVHYGSTPAFNGWLMKQGQTKEAIGQQAGISQTSEILVSAPQLLRKDKFAMGGAREMEGSGVTGDPRRASVAYGKQGLEMKIDAAVKQIKTLIAAK